MKNIVRLSLFITAFAMTVACSGKKYPDNIKPVTNFELNKYLGTWYEIARMDHSFERGLDQVTANYSMRDDGGVKVTNKGFDVEAGEWNESIGKAYFVENVNTGHLKVSFFGPFYGTYVIFKLDLDYQFAYIAGNNYDFLWFLSRTPTVTEQQQNEFIQLIESKGFNSENVIWVNQMKL